MDRLAQLKKLLSHPLSLLIGGCTLCLLILFLQLGRGKTLNELEERAIFLHAKCVGIEERQKIETATLEQMKRANRVYIEEVLAKLQFLKGEIAKLQILLHENPNNTQMKERLDFLQNGKNGFRLKEQNFQRLGNSQEVEVVQTHPVELSRDDLTHLLSQLENTPLGDATPEKNPPYFLIRQFDLLKKPHASDEETFIINLQMTKQEIVNE